MNRYKGYHFIWFIAALLISHASTAQLASKKTDQGIWILENGEKVLFYQAKTKSLDGKYPRANYIHPLYNVDGFELTEDFPKDHLHHRGIFWTWHQTIIDGKHIGDAWECKNFIWDVVEYEATESMNNSLTLNTKTMWKSPAWKDKNGNLKPFVEERTNITVHEKIDNYRAIDFEISLLALEKNLMIGGSDDQKGYGGFSVRVKLPEDIKFISARGEEQPITNQIDGTSWMNITGSLAENGKNGGVLIISNYDNWYFPEKWILRKKGSMQNPVYPGRQPHNISTTNPTVLKYRLVVYTGRMDKGIIDKIAADFK